ncbi:MAG: F0F1 ATP synthase subunit epsilon [Candidatus Paceibacterota bacterium]|jgi:F0F1-type ATP synthase epsilon subunit
MRLKVTSLQKIEYEGEIRSFNVKTEIGEITILDNHRPLITILKPCLAVITDSNNNKKEIEITSGFLEMNQKNELNVLVD